MTTVLIVDDEEGIRHGLSRFLEREGYAVELAEDSVHAESILKNKKIDCAILDLRLKEPITGLDLLAKIKEEDPEIPVIIITAYGSIESAIEAMKRGASDYILKPIDNESLLTLIKRNLEIAQLRRDNRYLKNELLQKEYQQNIITKSSVMLEILAKLNSVKDSTASILITGESGVGKEVFARYVHFTSIRNSGPFVSINCAALSEDLLLSELFGHEKGAFTGAIERKIGKFELANGGTLFLDEIGDMSLSTQAKLLRVLEENSFERVGGTKRINVDIRIITATNHKLHELIRDGRFRSDLYYRIATIEIYLPPLRSRKEDIPYLAEHFIQHYAERYHKQVEGLSPEVLQRWLSYDWPGNIRELQNVVHQSVLLCTGSRIEVDCLLDGLIDANNGHSQIQIDTEETNGPLHSLKEGSQRVIEKFECQQIQLALSLTKGNKSKAARMLGITRKTLLDKMKKYSLLST
ncbi:MAG TPA: sigma-54 dependent transcriptional regulator [Rectinema sp.]|nr:sigma-54 dependent transcriptional regulator [Rectinema sp.]HOR91906.1 sigma-54 dependent transcriptional regulator [Rectinema sp.]HOU61427.1 sigma-54 dependent transcriptional regulator [Rectinema sp.]HPL71373.1 sigma-54 dependent transcriptional regulator [Rectinema sp.]HPV59000.1 sigma-54 dependent transcriptional regulator [Rectinema sp.]